MEAIDQVSQQLLTLVLGEENSTAVNPTIVSVALIVTVLLVLWQSSFLLLLNFFGFGFSFCSHFVL